MSSNYPLAPGNKWAITGVAGFIGSHLLEELLGRDQEVTGLDNLTTGRTTNLDDVRSRVTPAQWSRFRFIRGDITNPATVSESLRGATRVLHQAAIASVPASIEDPATTHHVNVTGFLNILESARKSGVERVVYASSSAVYGDCIELPSREDRIGQPLSPYALSKRMDEEYAALFERCYGLRSVGLRYFNVFGPRQDPKGAYAAVIPNWIQALLDGRDLQVHGDGETSRDFCPVQTVVEANLRAATASIDPQAPRVFNIGLGRATSLNQLAATLRAGASRQRPGAAPTKVVHGPVRPGDIRHSWADTDAARKYLGFEPGTSLEALLDATLRWYATGTIGPSTDPFRTPKRLARVGPMNPEGVPSISPGLGRASGPTLG